ncbi:MAG: Calx-beta domain-containing protein [Acidimicrobiales bacterium]
MRARVVVIAVVLLGALVAGPAAAGSAPAASGITAETTSPTTGLDGGETVVVEVSGLSAGAEFRLGQWADADARTCYGDPYGAGADGTLTVPLQVSGWTYLIPPTGSPEIRGSRAPGACFLVAWRVEGPSVAEQDVIPLVFIGSQIEATFDPVSDLVDGQEVEIMGRSGAAAGRTVEVRQLGCFSTDQGAGCLIDEVLGFATVQPDDTFGLTVEVQRNPPRNGGGTFNCAAPTDGVEACEVVAFVQEDDGNQDLSRGEASAALSFHATFGVEIRATTVREGTGGVRKAWIPIVLTSPSASAVYVTVRTVNGTGGAPSDFAFTRATLRFEPGQTVRRLPVPIVTDSRDEERTVLRPGPRRDPGRIVHLAQRARADP